MRDEAFRREVRAALGRESVPPVNVGAIRLRSRPPATSRAVPYIRIAVAAVALMLVAAVLTPQTFANALSAIRLVFAPPPKALVRTISSEVKRVRSPQEAQSLLRFHLVPPRGLPGDAHLAGIVAGPSGTWSAKTKRWRLGPSYAAFAYRRRNGRIFQLQAEQYDPREQQNAYVWDADTGTRFDRVAWRNGDQQMSAVTHGVSRTELLRIERAMNGTPIAEVKTRGPRGGPKFFVIR